MPPLHSTDGLLYLTQAALGCRGWQGAASQMFERHAHRAAGGGGARLASVSASAYNADGGSNGSEESGFDPAFVAAFGQANVGDTSPNVLGAFCQDTGVPHLLPMRATLAPWRAAVHSIALRKAQR